MKARKSLEPWILDSIEFLDHQVDGVRWMARMKNFILGDDMGLGKTLQALTTLAIDVVRGQGDTAIVVAPVTLKGNWADEIKTFTRFPYVILGQKPNPKKPGKIKILTPEERDAQLYEFFTIEGPKILIANYEQIERHLDLINKMNFHLRIFDEGHYLKNHKAKRTKASMEIKAKRTFILTGTPMLNHVNELWTLLNMVWPKKFPSYWTYVNRYVVFGGFEGKQMVGVKHEKELKEAMQRIMLRRLSKDVLDLKEPRWIPRRVDLHPEQAKLYDQLAEEGVIDIDGMDSLEVENALTKFLRHKQICCTTATLLGSGKDFSYKLDLAAADALELVENGHRVVTFTQFRPGIESFKKRVHALGIETWEIHGDVPNQYRAEVVKQWGSAKPGILVCQTMVAGVGLNMTAARHCQFLDKLFVPGLNRQAWKRLDRIGADTDHAVEIYEYIVRGTIEQRVEQILRNKEKLATDIIEVEAFAKKLLKLLAAREEEESAA